MSPLMTTYVKSLKNPILLRYGISFITSEFVFGEKHKEIIKSLYMKCHSKLGSSPNSMHKYGASNVISNNEFEEIKKTLLPYIFEVFGIDPSKKCILHTHFSVHYGKYCDKKLDEHIDDSDITINICLKNTQTNTGLKFNQVPNTLFSSAKNSSVTINLEEGDIIIHLGNQPHQVLLQNYDNDNQRINLVLWLKFVS